MMTISTPRAGRRDRLRPVAAIVTLLLAASSARGALSEEQVLILYNSANADSQAVRDLYLAARPDVLEFDLNDTSLAPGNITRSEYLAKIRDPLRDHLNNGGSGPRSEQVIAIVTTRGLPARVRAPGSGASEFQLNSSFASLESELALLQQDLEAAGNAALPFRYSGIIDNPYHRIVDTGIDTFDRDQVETQRPFGFISVGAWNINGLTPGDLYLVCRLDSAPSDDATALENISAMIDRAQGQTLSSCEAQAFFDEYPAGDGCAQLDSAGLGGAFPGGDDFSAAAGLLESAGFNVTHDETFEFFEGPEVPDQETPLILLATYGENHKIGGCGQNPTGQGVYVQTYENIHPAGSFFSVESFNGNSLIDGTGRGNQGQVLDWIAQGGTFTVGHVAEPFTFSIPDVATFAENFYIHGLSFAEAAYSSLPGLSWQNAPVGDPLATVNITTSSGPDIDGNGVVDARDLAELLGNWGASNCRADVNGDGEVNATDLGILLGSWG